MHPRQFIPPRARPYAEILLAVSKEADVPIADIFSPSRLRSHCAARRMAVNRVKEARPKLSTNQLGILFGRHHTSILHILGRTERGRAVARVREAAE